MALAYTVNWIEQGRNPVEIGDSGSYETIQTQHRVVWYTPTGRPAILWRQSRQRSGVVDWTSQKTYAEITYKAVTVTATVNNVSATTAITEAQAAAIQADAYATGCVSCTTARIAGGTFEVTKVVRAATPLVANGTSTTDWGEWGDWTPALPEDEE